MKPETKHALLLSLLLCFGPLESGAETVNLKPVADTTLHEVSPANNLGGHTHVAAGATASPKPGGGFNTTRGLFRFDLASQIPASATITSAKLTVRVTFAPGAAPASTFELRRVLQPWGEGTKTGNTGQPAGEGEASWNHRLAPSASWSRPGGAAGVDFSSDISATVPVAGPAAYPFESTANLLADVRAWLSDPASNHGWILISQSENVPQTARRFGSREDANNAAELTIEYSAGAEPLRITEISREGASLRFKWTGGTPPYQVQRKARVSDSDWTAVGSPSTADSTTVAIDSAQALFRVASGQNVGF